MVFRLLSVYKWFLLRNLSITPILFILNREHLYNYAQGSSNVAANSDLYNNSDSDLTPMHL